MDLSKDILAAARQLLIDCREIGMTIGVAESCTGGLLAGALTEIPGSSDVFDRGYVTYSNTAKREMLGVPGDLIADHGAVSEPVARAMAEGVINNAGVRLSAAVTGVAGPGGGTALKPVGLVHIAAARSGRATLHTAFRFDSTDRAEIRRLSVAAALDMMKRQIAQG